MALLAFHENSGRGDILKAETREYQTFLDAVEAEARRQKQIWGDEHDAAKSPSDWFWTLGYLGSQILKATPAQRRQRIVEAAAFLANWHENS